MDRHFPVKDLHLDHDLMKLNEVPHLIKQVDVWVDHRDLRRSFKLSAQGALSVLLPT